MIKGLLLDFYGTVVEEDDEIVSGICARAAAGTRGMVTASQISTLWWRAFQSGMEATPFLSQRALAVEGLVAALTATGSTADPMELCESQFNFWRSAPLQAGARFFLESLDLPVCILSNIDRADIEAVLDHHKLSFDAVVTSEDVGAYKPSPRMFQRGLAVIGLQAEEVLHVGDSLTADVAGAQAAGIVPIWINRRQRPTPAAPEPIHAIAALADLGPLLNRLRAVR